MVWMNPKSYSFNVLSVFLHAPAHSGVYLLHNSARCLYIGDSDDIRQTLLRHMHGDNSAISVFGPVGFSFELHPEASRVRRRDELRSEFDPTIGNWGDPPDQAPVMVERLPHGAKLPLLRYWLPSVNFLFKRTVLK